MSPEQLKAWRMTLPRNADGSPATRKQAAEMLNGTPPNSYCDWEAGRRRIPRMLPLACEAVTRCIHPPKAWIEDNSHE